MDGHDMNLVIIRGIPGSGKSTFANLVAQALEPHAKSDSCICTTDDYDGLYSYPGDGEVVFHGGEKIDGGLPMIVLAHQWNQGRARDAMEHGVSVVVPNTNCQRWEFQPYLDMADEFGYRVTVVSLFDGGLTDDELFYRNAHGVPVDGIARMRQGYEHDWANADARPPWERE